MPTVMCVFSHPPPKMFKNILSFFLDVRKDEEANVLQTLIFCRVEKSSVEFGLAGYSEPSFKLIRIIRTNNPVGNPTQLAATKAAAGS